MSTSDGRVRTTALPVQRCSSSRAVEASSPVVVRVEWLGWGVLETTTSYESILFQLLITKHSFRNGSAYAGYKRRQLSGGKRQAQRHIHEYPPPLKHTRHLLQLGHEARESNIEHVVLGLGMGVLRAVIAARRPKQ